MSALVDPTTVVLCGMPSEAAILTAAFPHNLVLSGTAKANLPTLVPPGTRRIVSVGLSGGLYAPIRIAGGAVADTVTDGTTVWTCDRAWNSAVESLAAGAVLPREGDIGGTQDTEPAPWAANFLACPWYSSGVMDQADTAPQRVALYAATGAWAIDDETYSAAVFCAAQGILLNVCRFCSDDASDTLPLAARGQIMSATGSPDFAYLLKELVSEPLYQTLDLVAIAADYNASLASLRACAQALAAG